MFSSRIPPAKPELLVDEFRSQSMNRTALVLAGSLLSLVGLTKSAPSRSELADQVLFPTSSFEARLFEETNSPRKQLQLLREAKREGVRLGDAIFPFLKSESAQLQALELLQLDSIAWLQNYHRSGRQPDMTLRAWLLVHCCSTNVAQAIINFEPATDLRPTIRDVVNSRNNANECIVLGQLHRRPGMGPYDFTQVGRYQSEIFNTLLRMRHAQPDTFGPAVFLEELMEDSPSHDILRIEKLGRYMEVIGESAEKLDSVLPNFKNYRLGDTLNKEQLECLGRVGAGVVYAIHYPDAPIYATLTPELKKEKIASVRAIAAGVECNEAFRHIEADVMNRIDRYFESAPGKSVVLIYGLAHEFNREDLGDSAPNFSLSTVFWPTLANQSLWNFEMFFKRDIVTFDQQPELREALTRRSEALFSSWSNL